MADIQMPVSVSHKNDGPHRLWLAMIAGLVAWLCLVGYGTSSVLAQTERSQLVVAATWGVAVVFGGLFLVYTWIVLAGIAERERLRSTLSRALSLADTTLEKARRLDAPETR